MNTTATILAGFIPLAIGTVWYSDMLFGKAWQKAGELNLEKLKSGNMAITLGLALLFSMMLALILNSHVIHQSVVPGLFVVNGQAPTADSEEGKFLAMFAEKYGSLHRTFTHGVVHGIISALFFALPLIAINSLFEKRGWKYIAIHVGYWLLTLALMGGLICAWK
jgi:hypothetical protein